MRTPILTCLIPVSVFPAADGRVDPQAVPAERAVVQLQGRARLGGDRPPERKRKADVSRSAPERKLPSAGRTNRAVAAAAGAENECDRAEREAPEGRRHADTHGRMTSHQGQS